MPRKAKNEEHINKKGDLPSYSKTVSDFLDGKGRMLYGNEEEWARALFLFLCIAEDRNGSDKPSLDELIDYARQLGTSAMIKRQEFDEVVINRLSKSGLDINEAQSLIDSMSDASIKRVADDFDARPGDFSNSEHPIWKDNALRAIRSCVPKAELQERRSLIGIDIPRSVAGIMAAACLAASGTSESTAAPACGNGDVILGALDAAASIGETAKVELTASVPDGMCGALCKMSCITAGYPMDKISYETDKVGDNAVPTGFGHASYNVVLASEKPFFTQAWEYSNAHRDEDGTWSFEIDFDAPLTSPYPTESEKPLTNELSFVHFCSSLLAEGGCAALWIPSRANRDNSKRDLRKRIVDENLLDAVIEFRQASGNVSWLHDPMSIWLLRRGRPEREPVLLALLDGEGFDAFCGGSSDTFYAGIDKALGDNPAALKIVEMLLNRTPVDRCAVLVTPETITQNDSYSFRFIDYASNIDVAANLASAASWGELIAAYQNAAALVSESDSEFLAALEHFDKLMGDAKS